MSALHDWKDAFGAKLEVGTLVTYAMKKDGGMVYPAARIVGKAPTGWPQVEFEPGWLNEFNAPWVEALLKHSKEPEINEAYVTVTTSNMISMRRRAVAPQSLIRLDTHPAFANR